MPGNIVWIGPQRGKSARARTVEILKGLQPESSERCFNILFYVLAWGHLEVVPIPCGSSRTKKHKQKENRQEGKDATCL